MLKITKFGGSSVANAEQFKKIKAIIQQDPTRRYIVVSAPGKRFAADNKITDLLYLLDATENTMLMHRVSLNSSKTVSSK